MASCSRSLSDLSHDELAEWCRSRGEASYRAGQIQRWVFQRRVESFALMQDLPQKLRSALDEEFELFSLRVVRHDVARDGTEKLLLEAADGAVVESVLMRESERRTVCISTQVGCAMGCVFCASGLLGWKRNLSVGEILDQVLLLDRLLPAEERITNVVVMGIGEPLANLPLLLDALDVLATKEGLGLAIRRVTISTVGLPEKIRELAEIGKPYKLAVSLHAPNDRLRSELVPVNEKIGIDAIIAAADEYHRRTRRRVTYEYVLLGGINDAAGHARELATRLKGRRAHVNLIPMNRVTDLPFRTPTEPRTRRFATILEQAGIRTTIRKRKGADIDAACGQLRLEREQRPLVELDG